MKRAWATLTKGNINALCEFHAYEQISNNLPMIFTYEINYLSNLFNAYHLLQELCY
jgi:hypothetical protein